MRNLADLLQNIAICFLSIAAVTMVSIRVHDRFWGNSQPETRHVKDWRQYAQGGFRLGPENAPVTIVEFADFQCPVCKEAWQGLRDIREQSGKDVAVVYRNFPLPMHKLAIPAAHAAACAAEMGRFEPYHDLLFSSQATLGQRRWAEYAQSAGISNETAFESCMTSPAAAARVEQDIAAGNRLGVKGTPTFLINDLEVGGYAGPDDVGAKIRDALRSAGKRSAS